MSIIQKLLGRKQRHFATAREETLKELDYALCAQAYERYVKALDLTTPTSLCLPEPAAPKVSIIIPVYNQYAMTMRCLGSLAGHTKDIACEVILADDNSTDETRHIASAVTGLKLVKNPGKRGFVNNCNHAACSATGEYLYFLNNDTLVFPGTVRTLAETLDADPAVAVVGSKCILPGGKLQAAGSYWEKGGFTGNTGRYDNPLKPEYNEFRLVDYCTGASLMLRRSFWLETGGFDPAYAPGYYEETDLCAQAAARGLKVAYQPLSEVIHFEKATFGNESRALMERNRRIFLQKWRRQLSL